MNRKTVPSIRFASRALALTIALGAPSAASAKVGILSGNLCAPGKSDVSKVNHNQIGIQNESPTSSAKVWCPLVVDEAFYGPDELHVDLRVLDQNSGSGKDVVCTLYGVDFSGQVGYNPPPERTSGSYPEPTTLVFYNLPNPWLHYTISCTLPASVSGRHSRVVAYGPADHD